MSAELYKGLVSVKDRGFRDQLTRASLSIASNIAEGYGRGRVLKVRQFLRYAKGSAAEVETQICIGMDIGYIDKTQGKAWAQEAQEIQSILAALIRKDRRPAR